ncbi:Hypothetical predicted protein [Lecanosticta acicola]|uniref:Uncharacterized protein n=1 Tax=Lecanosticta acicola TaxID=111012 RepID=A0AAI8Z5Q8_9PEZI|nr:Hypothetical predicted protein [Lecanosticta acicola]
MDRLVRSTEAGKLHPKLDQFPFIVGWNRLSLKVVEYTTHWNDTVAPKVDEMARKHVGLLRTILTAQLDWVMLEHFLDKTAADKLSTVTTSCLIVGAKNIALQLLRSHTSLSSRTSNPAFLLVWSIGTTT